MKKIFTLFAAALMAGSMMAGNLIKFEEPAPAGSLNGQTFGEDFELTITDTNNKVSIDASGATFGFSEEETVSFTYRLKTGGKSSSANKMSLVVPEEGPLVIYARTGSNNDTTRYFVIANGSDTIVKHICKESDVVADASSKIYLPVIVENVPAGTYEVTYPLNSINFYGFQLGYDAPADPIELEFTSFETEVGTSSVLIILNGPDVELIYDAEYADKSIAGLHNEANQLNTCLTVNEEEDYVVDGTAEFTFVSVTQSIVYTYKLTLNLVGASGNEYHGEAQIEIVGGDFSNDITPTALSNTAAAIKATKLVENGQVVILRDGKKFNALGAKL